MAGIKAISIDIECFSLSDLTKTGVYRYSEDPSFEVLLFGYSVDAGPVQVVDLANGELLPVEIRCALTDPFVTKWAFNASFERICLSRFLGLPSDEYLDSHQWRCSMIWSAYLGLPLSLAGVGAVLKLEKQKIEVGKNLIKYFCQPCTPTKTNGGRTRNRAADAPDKWTLFKFYNLRDVETEMAVQGALSRFSVPDFVWDEYHLDQKINDRGIRLDMQLVNSAICMDTLSRQECTAKMQELTTLDNPNSVPQMKAWLAENGLQMESLGKKELAASLKDAYDGLTDVLLLRQQLAKTSVKKYQAIITFGSPCTDMSVAGKRAGLEGKQSVLFYEAIRIIREMRSATHGKYPRFIVWENVPGAFSSNRGEDFRAVLTAIVQTAEPEAEVPAPDKKGWPTSDVLLGNGWSVAYRTVDAQYFGVAQRRRRIYLVADFGSECAGEILFEREGVSRDFASGFLAEETAAGHPADRAGTAVAFEPGAASRLGGHCWTEHSGTLRADAGDNQTAVVIDHGPVAFGIGSMDSEGMKSDNPLVGFYEAQTARTIDRSGGNPSCHQGGIAICARPELPNEDSASIAFTMTTGEFTQVCREQSPCLQARDYKDPPVVGRQRYTVRRLTPSECAKLQGFPDDWCAGLGTPTPTEDEITWWAQVFETHRRIMGVAEKPRSRKQIIKWLRQPYSVAAEYMLWGNGVALPCVCFALRGITELVATEQQKNV